MATNDNGKKLELLFPDSAPQVGALYRGLKEVVDERGQRLSFAAIIGVLETLKFDVYAEQNKNDG